MGSPAAIWDLYRTFLAVAQEGSFTGAARRLQITQPTVGRQINSLEAMLGTGLFTRSPRGLKPTEAGLDLVPHAEAMASAAAAALRGSSADVDSISGAVRLAAGDLVGVEVLPQILAEFCHAHPQIELELALSNRNEDLLRGEADVAVRMMRPVQKALLARRVGVAQLGLFAHTRYVEKFGLPQHPSELARHRAIGPDRDFHALRTGGPVGSNMRREDFRFRTDNVAAQLAAMRAGIGIAACHKKLAQRDSSLVPVLPEMIAFEREIWVAMHEDARRVRRIRLLFDAVAAGLAAYASSD
ncbi:MAG TPA: LysR family transcriptional regulator [Phenylobacterium sp.]|uniref:LysR family transcriptional regulator n=1 Tax=Phenylobacterium sp. TaxID=1871053 RepID=UPI002C79EB22|nr:LysR family transcriptional regulator [Phenylobacterium sp.]HSV03224.1 LysR family transcriptional regulator [Phenylobacterium sp.]